MKSSNRKANKDLYQRILRNEIMGADMPDTMEDEDDQENARSSFWGSGAWKDHDDSTFLKESSLSYISVGNVTSSNAPAKLFKRNVFTVRVNNFIDDQEC